MSGNAPTFSPYSLQQHQSAARKINPMGAIASSSFNWRIKNFSALSTEVGYSVGSPVMFLKVEKHCASFFLLLYPNGYSPQHEGYISLILCSKSHVSVDTFSTGICIKILNQTFSPPSKICRIFSKKFKLTYLRFASRRSVNQLLVNDALTVECKLSGLFRNREEKRSGEPGGDLGLQQSIVLLGLWQQYLNQRLVDFTCVVQEKEFKVHKAVLAAHSPVFESMCNHDMLESRQNRVVIRDCSSRAFEVLIKWMYLKEVEEVHQVSYELFVIADKYDMNKLKTICEWSIISKLSANDAIKILRFADFHRASWLKSKSLEFIKLNASKVFASKDWPSLINDPNLVGEVLRELASFIKAVLR